MELQAVKQETKKVYIYQIAPRPHTALQQMISNPPQGYEFILPQSPVKTKVLKYLLGAGKIKWFYRNIIRKFLNPLKLYNSMYGTKIPQGIDLVFSESQALDIQIPYVVEILDSPYALAGGYFDLFLKNKADIEKKLLSPYCKKIIIVNESSWKIMQQHFSSEVIGKSVLVRAGFKSQPEKNIREREKDFIQILFVGSMANPDDFEIKGGLEVFEVYKKLSQEFINLKLVVSCIVPQYAKEKYKDLKNIQLIEKKISWEERKKIYEESDICLNPGHMYPLMATLEAMSFGLPIIMLDTFGVQDYIQHEINGLLVKPSENIRGYKDPSYPTNLRSKYFIEEIKRLEPDAIERLSQATRKLILNQGLRRRLGDTGRKLIATKFSLKKRNQLLKKTFDDAIENNIRK